MGRIVDDICHKQILMEIGGVRQQAFVCIWRHSDIGRISQNLGRSNFPAQSGIVVVKETDLAGSLLV